MGQQLTTVVCVESGSGGDTGSDRAEPAERVLQLVHDRLGPYDGRVAGRRGGTVVLTFASPRSAVAFALAVGRAAVGGAPARIGLNFGEVPDDEPAGEAVEVALELARRARDGEILVTDLVRHLAGSLPGLRFVDRGRVGVRGSPTRWQIHRVLAAAEAAPAAPVFGRDAELQRIDELLAAVAGGSGRILLLEGEAGIGKSHLARAAASRAAALGVSVVSGGAEELERDHPGRILAGLAAGMGVDFVRLAPTDVGAGEPADPAYAVVERFLDELEDVAAERPLLLVVEDLHWADELSLRGLAAVARRVGPLGAGLIGTMRPTPRPASLHRFLDICTGEVAATVALAGLDAGAVAGLVTSLTGAAPGGSLRRRLDAASGNPLYVSELVRALEEEGALRVETGVADTDADGIPEGLAQTLMRRISALPEDTAETLRLASLLGSGFALGDLATVAGRSVVDVAALLRPAVDAALIAGEGSQLSFRHDLIREAVYLDVPPAIRTDLHRAAGQALAAVDADAAKVARQFSLGGQPGDLVAVSWLLRAAHAAEALDTTIAVSHYERALTLAPSDWSGRCEVESRLVELLAWAGRVDDARSLAARLLDRSLSDAEELMARRAYGAVLSTVGELAGAAEQLAAAAALPVVSDVEAHVLRCAAAGMSVIAGNVAAEEADAEARRHLGTADPTLACWAHNTLAVAAVTAGAYDAQAEHARIACTLLEANHVPPLGFLIPQTWLPTAWFNLDDFAQAQTAAAAARQLGERRGDVGLVVHALTMGLALRWASGAWDDAGSEIEAALTLADETGVDAQKVVAHAIGADIAHGRGDRQRTEAHLQAGEELFATGTQHPFGLDALLLTRSRLLEVDGDTEAARMVLRMVWEQTASLRGLIQWRLLGPELVRLERQLGDLDAANEVAAAVEQVAARSSSPSGRAAALRARALAGRDPAPMLAAVELLRATPRLIETATVCEEAGSLLVDHGRADEGTALLDEAARLHADMGAAAHLARVDAALRGAGVRRRRSPASTAATGWDALSPKEREVVALVAAGLSNPQIASQLYISRRTVESHLSHVFRKLGLANRTQLAAAAVERGTSAETD